MPAYTVVLGNAGARNLVGGANAAVVFAADVAAAKEVCQAKFGGGSAYWSSDVTVTEIVADADFDGWTFNVIVEDIGTATFVGDATSNLIDEVGDKLVIACNALTGIAGSAYNATSQVLTIAETTDGLGDKAVQVEIIPPSGDSSITELVGTIVDEGAAGALLSVVLPADAAVLPIVAATFAQV